MSDDRQTTLDGKGQTCLEDFGKDEEEEEE